jgi:hypothetical protein
MSKKKSRRDASRAEMNNDNVAVAADGEPGADGAWAKIEALCGQIGDVVETAYNLKGVAKRVETMVKFALNARPRMAARDDEIVRLKDQEGLDWTAVWHRIRKHPAWGKGPGGKTVTKKALQVAYRRRRKAAGG